MTSELFRYYQTRQRTLAKSTLLPPEFDKVLHALVVEFRQQVSTLDALGRESLCRELGTQLQRELIHAANARHRKVLLALLRKIERTKYQSPTG